ncbi:MAG: endonuclease/exonuclease/phosphatase family protein [Candidatus Omnitrophica bacterium]|nr:endonuclease/exonuclease/phosphatase family protein [Candidatus Omnitrophota bacterium]
MKLVRYQEPEFLSFEDLVLMSENQYPQEGRVRQRFENLWLTPIISNEAHYAGKTPHRPTSPELGKFVRVVTWNIEQSLNMAEAISAFTDEEAFEKLIDTKRARPGRGRHRRVLNERKLLVDADIIILQEMDLGVKRSGYRNAVKDLAQAAGMNYAYLPEYLEVDPVILGRETITFEGGGTDIEATEYYRVDPKRFKGLFGCAVLSRYPIVYVEGFRLYNQGYDWYGREKQKTSYLERLRRFSAREVFNESLHREVKMGGRTYFRVDLEVPGLPEERISIINVHLEIKCGPELRTQQMAEILSYIKAIGHPVILAGDFNSAPYDLSPTSTPRVVEKGLMSPAFALSRVLDAFLPQALFVGTMQAVSTMTKNYQNPTAPHVPVLAPNRVGELFKIIERFRFNDGSRFDFRGGRGRSAGYRGTLSNSNERDKWGYKTTFKVDRALAGLVGKFRLDWIFVKAYLTQPHGHGSYRFAPHFGRTLNDLNKYLKLRISDHDPCLVDLPLGEPA